MNGIIVRPDVLRRSEGGREWFCPTEREWRCFRVLPMCQEPNEVASASAARVFGAAPPGVTCRPRRAAYAVIAGAGGRVAAIRAPLSDGTERYWLPGGGMEAADESPRATVVREVREELGRGVGVQEVLGEAVQFFFAGDEDRWYEMRATFFRAVLLDDLREGGEYELHWVDPRAEAGRFFHECHAWAACRA